jgi:hypothetical protein
MTVGTPRMSAKEIMGAAQNLCPSVSSGVVDCHKNDVKEGGFRHLNGCGWVCSVEESKDCSVG